VHANYQTAYYGIENATLPPKHHAKFKGDVSPLKISPIKICGIKIMLGENMYTITRSIANNFSKLRFKCDIM